MVLFPAVIGITGPVHTIDASKVVVANSYAPISGIVADLGLPKISTIIIVGVPLLSSPGFVGLKLPKPTLW